MMQKDKVQVKGLNYVVIDECDSILIDDSRTPLIISGGNKANAALYIPANRFARSLTKGIHFDIDIESKAVFLTEKGAKKAETDFSIENLYDLNNAVLKQIMLWLKMLIMLCKMMKLLLLMLIQVVY